MEQATHSKLMLMSKVRTGNHAQADMQTFFFARYSKGCAQ